MALERDRVAPLDALDDYRIAEGDPDVRGWKVFGTGGRRIGTVDELLADTVAMKIRYLEVDVDEDLLDRGEDRHVLIPIGHARLNPEDDEIFVDALDPTAIAMIPPYGKGAVTRDYEARLRTHFDRDYTAGTPASADFYAHDLYDEDRFFAGRRGSARRALDMSESERRQFGEVGRGIEGDGISPEDDLDHVHGP